MMVKFKPHKFYEHHQRDRKKFSKLENNDALQPWMAAIFSDYSENWKLRSGRSCTVEEYRKMPDASLMNTCCFLVPNNSVIRIDCHNISNDSKHDTCLSPKNFELIIADLLSRYPQIKHIEITTDTAPKEYKAVSVFVRVGKLSVKFKISILMSTFGSGHGKFIHDPSGKIWLNEYNKNCVGNLGPKAANLENTADYMNQNFF
jgi:hypothetical protein